jgi:hypothetical protein
MDALPARHPRAHAHAAVGDRGPHGGHLQRRRKVAVLTDRGGADGEVVLEVAGDRAGFEVGQAQRLVEAERLGEPHEPAGAELGAERREDRVAGVRERGGQRPAAGLAARVGQPHAGQHGPGLDGIGARRLRDPRLQRARERDDLERRAGRLRAVEREPSGGEHGAGARPDHGHAADAVAERAGGDALEPRRERGLERVPAADLDAPHDAAAEVQLGARPAADARVVERLQAASRLAARGRCARDGGQRRLRVERAAVGGQDRAPGPAGPARGCGRSRRCAAPAAARRATSPGTSRRRCRRW